MTSSPAGRRSGPEQAGYPRSKCPATNARLGGSPADISLNPTAQVEVSRPAYIAVMNIRVEVIVWLKDLLPGCFLERIEPRVTWLTESYIIESRAVQRSRAP